VDTGNAADISDIHDAHIFRGEVQKVGKVSVCMLGKKPYRLVPHMDHEGNARKEIDLSRAMKCTHAHTHTHTNQSGTGTPKQSHIQLFMRHNAA
jgi:hypothetical protein